MRYKEVYLDLIKNNLCPFCDLPEGFYIEKSKYFFVSYARAPYIKDHLLIIPNRHVVLFNDLKWEEVQDLMHLVSKRDEKLHTKHHDVNLLLRDGFIGGKSGKSVNHMHFHLVPDIEIFSANPDGENRKFLSEKEMLKETNRIIENFS